MSATAAVRMTGVSKRYPHFRLEEIDLVVPAGQITGFLGANGAGKSTAIRILMGMVSADKGDVEVLGHSMPHQQVLAKRDIGFVSEDYSLYPQVSLEWHMQWMASLFPSWDDKYARQLTRSLYLNPRASMQGLSLGERVKSALLLALARRPRLLVLDEPTTGLDPVARHEVLAALMEVVADEERTVLFSSQNTRDVEQIADRIAFIDHGRMLDVDDAAQYTERWRRLRLELPAGAVLPSLDGTVEVAGSGRAPVITTRRFSPALLEQFTASGVAVRAVEHLSMEEIFVLNVMSHRQEHAA